MIRDKAVVPLYLHTCQCGSSVNPDEFLSFLLGCDYAWQIYEVQQFPDPFSRRYWSGCCKVSLPPIEDKLLFILTYFKRYLFPTNLGFLLGLSPCQAQVIPNIPRKFCKIKKCLRLP